MDDFPLGSPAAMFERMKKPNNGVSYWLASELGTALGYDRDTEAFREVLKRARISCATAGYDVSRNFSLRSNPAPCSASLIRTSGKTFG
jgi:hypothetical protein